MPRPGYRTVNARMFVDDPESVVEFLRSVFDATGALEAGRPAEIRLGDSLVMVAGTTERDAFPAFLYVYVDDADDAFRRALDSGAMVVEPPLDTPYGDRRATVRDEFGNVFQIAHVLTGRAPAGP